MRYCAQARCIENHVYAAIAGSVGNLPNVRELGVHYAQSGIFTPSDIPFERDAIAAEATPNIEMVIFEDLDLELLKTHRQSGTVLNWRDRRTDLYDVRYVAPPETSTAKPAASIRLSELVPLEAIDLALEARSKPEALARLAELLFGSGTPAAARTTALLTEREDVSPTGVGRGVALPHCRSADTERVLVAFAYCPAGIDFGASDGEPARILVALVSPAGSTGVHLAVLARLAALLQQGPVRKAVAEVRDPAELPRLLEAQDERYETALQARSRPGVKTS